MSTLYIVFLYLTSVLLALFKDCVGEWDSDIVKYYEPVRNQLLLMGRTSDGKSQIYLSFEAFKRRFKLTLTTGNNILSTTAEIIVHENNKQPKKISASSIHQHLVTGKVQDDPNSWVVGSLYENRFLGDIYCDSEIYYVESSNSYFDSFTDFESIIYRHSDVNMSYGFCGNKSLDACVWKQPLHPMTRVETSSTSKAQRRIQLEHQEYDEKYLVCTMKLVADHTFFQLTGKSDYAKALAEMIGFVVYADNIFRNTDFEVSFQVGLQIVAIEIYSTINQAGYIFSELGTTVEELLTTFSEYNFGEYCQATAIVQRTFPEGSIGLAYLAGKDDCCGVCAKRRDRSMNTAVVTVEHFGRRIPRAMASFMFVHQLGHSFGAEHDPIDNHACYPTDTEGGQFIMSIYARDGTQPNNKKFSKCSILNMGAVISEIKCLRTPIESVCGNAITEYGEECDCGSDRLCDLIDSCCDFKTCKIKRGSSCSSREQECCNKNCEIVSKEHKMACNPGKQCLKHVTCDGVNANCPAAKKLPDGTECDNGAGECRQGICVNIICERHNLFPCECEKKCELCCISYDLCRPGSQLNINNRYGKAFVFPDGRPCFGGIGVCQNGVCQNPEISSLDSEIDDDEDTKDRMATLLILIILAGVMIVISIIILIMLLFCSPLSEWLINCWNPQEPKDVPSEEI